MDEHWVLEGSGEVGEEIDHHWSVMKTWNATMVWGNFTKCSLFCKGLNYKEVLMAMKTVPTSVAIKEQKHETFRTQGLGL